ncbi:MAG: hypothetical protein GQ538_07660 [Xanthomonadales bacterium]|jgi:hypothetical protein|nr:hypothetical protein [Xanthomonadales bacterium]
MNQKQALATVDSAILKFKRGQVTQLESALGTLLVGRQFGWKVLYLVHDKKTLRRYEEILGVEFRAVLAEEGPLAERSLALRLARKAGNFWKAVKGEIPGIRSPELS